MRFLLMCEKTVTYGMKVFKIGLVFLCNQSEIDGHCALWLIIEVIC